MFGCNNQTHHFWLTLLTVSIIRQCQHYNRTLCWSCKTRHALFSHITCLSKAERQIKPCAAMNRHHWVNHSSPHEDTDLDSDTNTHNSWLSSSAKILALLQQTCATGQSSVDKKRRYGSGWLHSWWWQWWFLRNMIKTNEECWKWYWETR